MHDVFAVLLKDSWRLSNGASLLPFLVISVRNGALDQLRRRTRRQARELEHVERSALPATDPSQRSAQAEEVERLLRQISRLPDDLKETLSLRTWGEMTFEKIAEELSSNGFEVELMGPKSVAIQAVPAGVVANDAEHLLMEILDGLERENAAISIDTLQSKIAASTACHAAIKVNMPLDQTKMEWLLGALAKTDCPMSCPHGRPVVLRYSVKEIEKAFHRI